MPNTRCNNCCELFVTYIYMMWDGLGFFGHDDNKLSRLKGVKPRWYDRFLNKRWLLFNMTFIVFLSTILLSEYENLGEIKSQEKQSDMLDIYEFDSREFFKLTGKVKVYLKTALELIDKKKPKDQ